MSLKNLLNKAESLLKSHPVSTTAAIFLAAGLLIYANSFQNAMFWDDDDFILKNRYIKDWKYVPQYFSENVIAGSYLISNYWRPLLLSVFSLEWHLWGHGPAGYHVVNTLVHTADGLLLFIFLFSLFKHFWLAWGTSFIFLIHPLQTEAVVYVNSLGDSLSSFFILSGLIFYHQFLASRKPACFSIRYYLSVLCYPLGLMSKETAFIFPALIVITDFLGGDIQQPLKKKFLRLLKVIWPFLIMAGIYILLRATILNFQNTFNFYKEANVFTSSWYVRLLTFFKVLAVYWGLMFSPRDLHVERTMEWAATLFSPLVMLGALFFIASMAFILCRWKKSPVVSFGLLWFFISIAPTSNVFIPINANIYEHWLYLPLIGIFLILLHGLTQWFSGRANVFRIVFFLGFSIFLSVASIQRNREWKDAITLYEHTLRYAPDSYRVINNLGMAYADKGNHKKAEKIYLRAITIDPSNPVAYHNLANTYRETGRIPLALEKYEKAIAVDPKFLFAYGPLVDIYLKRHDLAKARGILEQYTQYVPANASFETFLGLAQLASEENDFQGSLSYLKKAQRLQPENQQIQTSIISLEKILQQRF